MKNFYKVSNTIENGPRMDRKRTVVGPMKDRVKSRISPINHRLWTVIAPMLLVAFGLFGVNENAWGATWTGKVSVASGSGTAKVEIYNDSDNKTETSASSTSSTEKTATYSESTSWTHWYIRDHHFIFTATPSTGYHFVKWTGDVTSTTTPYTTSKGNGGDTKTLKANFALNTYAVQFNNNGGSGTMSNQNFTYSVNQNLTANAFTKTGYTFSGWNTQDNGKGKSYSDGQSVSNLTTENGGTVTLYAQWTANTYYVAFNGNGSTSGSMSNQTFKYDAAQKLNTNTYIKTDVITFDANGGSCGTASISKDASFVGWATSANGDKVYDNQQSVSNLTTTHNQTLTLYAKWSQSQTITLPSATKANCVLAGWSDGENNVGEAGQTYAVPLGGKTLTAIWIAKYPFTVEGSNYELFVEETKSNAFIFTHAHNPVVNISPSGIISYENNTITALSEGEATIYFSQSDDSETILAGESDHWTVTVKRVSNTLALNVAAAQNKYVDEEITGVITGKNSNATVETSSTDATTAYYDVADNKIVIDNNGNNVFTSKTVTIKIWQAQNVKYTASGEKTITLTVNKYAPTISVNKTALELEQTATLTTTNTTADLNVTIEPATGVLSYANGTFTAVGLGDAKVTVTQPETRTISTKQEVYNFHVSKKTPTLVVKMDGTATTSKSVSRGTVVNVTFEDNSDADVVVTNVSGARAASYINGQMTAGYVGTAVYRASLAETDTYQAKSVDFSLTVTGTPSDHVPYTNATGYTIGSGSATDWTHSSKTIHFNGIPDKLTFNYAYIFQVEEINLFGKKISIGNPTLSYDALDDFAKNILKLGNYSDTRKGKGNTHFLYVEESADGNTWSTIWTNDDASSKDTKYSGEIQLQRTTRYIRFHHSSNFSNSYTNINISELRYVEDPDPASVDFGSAIINSGEVSKKVMINWCNIAPLTVTSSNDRFYVSPSSFGNYENYGTQELTIRFSHVEEGSFSGDITISNGVDTYDKTIHVTAETTKRPQTITWNSDLVATGYAMNVGEQYPDEVITTIATATNGGKITYTSDNTDVIEVIDGVSLSAVGTGNANITAYQAGDDYFDEVSDTKEFTVTELQKQVITWNQNLYGLLTTSENMTLNATATSGMAITYESADENVVRVEGNTLIVVGEGETYITASQAGGKDANDVEWLPISQNNYVIVRDPNSPCNGMALSIGSLTLNSGKLSQDTTLSGIPAVLTFTAKHGTKNASTWGSAIYSALIVYQYAQIENLWGWYEVYNQVVGTGDTPSGDIILDETATKIRFKTLETGTDHTISNIRVTRPKFMNSDVSEVDQEVETNALWQKTVTISHSNIDVMNISTKKGLLTLSTSSLGDGCEDSGEDQFVVSYTPIQKDAEYLDTIVITDSKAEPTMITIPIRLHTTGWNQEIENFNLPAAALTTDALALTATATSGLDVRYESTDEAIVRIVNGNELEIITSGTVAIKAIQDGNNRYYETSAEQTITISKVNPTLHALTGTSVTYGGTLSQSTLSGGSATATFRGAENTPVDGTFAWTNPNQPIMENVGKQSYSVTFTPSETAAAYYNSVTTMVEIDVVAATPTLSWTSAPENVDYNAAGVVYAAGSNSNGTVTYSIISGESYAHIDANTGALTVDVPDHTITIQAVQAANGNYAASSAITVEVTIGAVPPAPIYTYTGNGNWTDGGKWDTNDAPEDAVDVVVNGNVIINTEVTVASLTINNGYTVTVVDHGKLTVNGASAGGAGDLYVANGGEVEVAGSLIVRDLIVEASIGTSEGNAESGQVASAENIVYTNAYIDINMDPEGHMDDTKWYGFTVPFAVDAHNGVSRLEGTAFRQCGYGVHYMIAEYDANKRLNTGNGWKYISGNTLNAGQFYFFTVGDGSYNTYRFKASGNSYTPAAAASLNVNGPTTNYDANWNGVGNSTLQHVTASYYGGEYVQVFMNGQDAYKTVSTNDANFVVGCPFFIQAKEATTLLLSGKNTLVDKYYAPRRMQAEATAVSRINLSATDGGYSDQIYFSAVDKEQDAYIIGQDLSKAGESKVVPQLWMAQYNQKLSVHEAAWNGDRATCPLGIYAPKSGEYVLTATQPEDGTQIYLTENGAPIWDLTMSEYVLSLEKGNTSSYGLMIVRAPQVTTGVEDVQGAGAEVRKVIIDNTMYIITPEGTMFNVIGKKVQ